MSTLVSNIAAFLRLYVLEPGYMFELRGLRTVDGRPQSVSAFCTYPELAGDLALWMEGKGYAIYFLLNPVSPESPIGRAAKPNVIHKRDRADPHAPRAAKDADIAYRRLLLVDVDPVREGGCATDEEKQAAGEVARSVHKHCLSLGWPKPCCVDSGNGCHLLWRIPRLTDTETVKGVLHALARRFDTERAKVDTSVHNAARISRLPGTINRKGEDTPERPHRRSAVIRAGDDGEVRLAALQALAAESASPEPSSPPPAFAGTLRIGEQEVLAFLEKYDDVLIHAHTERRADATYFALAECPFAGREHEGMDAGAGKTAIILGKDHIGFHCFAGSCAEYGFKELRELLERETGRPVRLRPYAFESGRAKPKRSRASGLAAAARSASLVAHHSGSILAAYLAQKLR